MVYFQRLTPIRTPIRYYHEYKETKRILYETDIIVHLAIWPTDFRYAEGGKALYLEAQCQKCHLQDAKFDPNSIKKEGAHSKVGNMKQVKKWVVSCDNYFDIGWFPEDQEKVAAYLNSVHYRYDTKGSKK